MPSVGTRGSGHKIKYKKFHLNIRKYTENWHRVPREAVESASLEIFKTPLGNWLWVAVLEQETLHQMAFRGPFPPQTFCDYVISFLNARRKW